MKELFWRMLNGYKLAFAPSLANDLFGVDVLSIFNTLSNHFWAIALLILLRQTKERYQINIAIADGKLINTF
ncbi:MAG: hypothetical protein WBB28_13765 [Crinalium sp.]